MERFMTALTENDWWWSKHNFFFPRVEYTLYSSKEWRISVIFIFPIHRYIHNFSWGFLFLDQKAHQLRAKANKHPFYLYLNSPVSPESSDAVQDLAGSLKPFPQRLPYKTPMPQWLSASAVPSLGHEDWFSFSLQVKVQSVCPLPTTLRDQQYNHQINLKNSSRGSLPTTSVLLAGLSAPYINEGKPCWPRFPQQLHAVVTSSCSVATLCVPCVRVHTQHISTHMHFQDGILKLEPENHILA